MPILDIAILSVVKIYRSQTIQIVKEKDTLSTVKQTDSFLKYSNELKTVLTGLITKKITKL